MRWFWSRRRREAELREEIQFDLDRETAENTRAGLNPADARIAARKTFGNIALAQESTRDVWGWMWLEQLAQDVSYAVRSARKNPGFTAAVVLSIALGVGANAAMFSVIRAVLLQPIEFRDAGRLVQIWEHPAGGDKDRSQSSGPDFIDFRDQNTSFASITAMIPSFTFPVSGAGEPILARFMSASPEFFDVFGIRPMIGRIYEPAEYHDGANALLISYGFWQRQFGGDPNVVGKKVEVNHSIELVIGVMPPTHDMFSNIDGFRAHVSDYSWARQRGNKFLDIVGRLKPGVTVAQAQQEMQAIYRRMPGVTADATVEAIPLKDQLVGDVRPRLTVLMAAVALVLLVTCVNVANLLLARGAARQKEIVTRVALGASRGRILRQFAAESIVLSTTGGAVGVLLAKWLVSLLLKFDPRFLPRVSLIRVDADVLLFSLAVSVLAGLFFGLAPALAASRTVLIDKLRSRGEAATQWGRGMLVASELAMAVVLLVGAGLLARSFWRLMAVNPGYRTDNLLTLGLRPTDRQVDGSFYLDLLERVGARPGVEAAAVSDCSAGFVSTADILATGRAYDPNHVPVSDACFVSPGYFSALGIPLRKGRAFDRRDGAKSPPVIVVSESLAEQLWPGENPIGKRLAANYRSLGRPTEDAPVTREVVGVAGEARMRGIEIPARVAVYLPYQQDASRRSLRAMTLYVRSGADPERMSSSIQSDVRAVGPDVPVLTVRTMKSVISRSIAPRTFTLALIGAFAGLALVLAAVGLYGVISYSVARRTREIGIRVALGATRSDVLGSVVGREMRWLGLGLIAGLAGAAATSRLLSGLLFGVVATDAVTYTSVVALLATVAVVAAIVPARKASKVDPVLALREE